MPKGETSRITLKVARDVNYLTVRVPKPQTHQQRSEAAAHAAQPSKKSIPSVYGFLGVTTDSLVMQRFEAAA